MSSKLFLGHTQDWWLKNYKFDFEAGTVHRIGKKKLIIVGRFDKTRGYYRFGFNRTEHALHRLVFFAYHGKIRSDMVIDHRDSDRTNNAVTNLREVTTKENAQNARKFKRGTCPANGKWFCRVIGRGGKVLHVSQHNTEDEAHDAYLTFKLIEKTKLQVQLLLNPIKNTNKCKSLV